MAVPKAEELVATPYRHGGKNGAEAFFLDGMGKAIHQLAEQAHPAFPVTIYYAFKQSETKEDGTSSAGWETFLQAVIDAGFCHPEGITQGVAGIIELLFARMGVVLMLADGQAKKIIFNAVQPPQVAQFGCSPALDRNYIAAEYAKIPRRNLGHIAGVAKAAIGGIHIACSE